MQIDHTTVKAVKGDVAAIGPDKVKGMESNVGEIVQDLEAQTGKPIDEVPEADKTRAVSDAKKDLGGQGRDDWKDNLEKREKGGKEKKRA